MRIRVSGLLQEMAAEDILDHVPASVYKRIKASDPKPEFRAYCIGHEGESTGKVVGIGRVVKNWVRSAIENMNAKLALGTKCFRAHGNETNDHDGRRPVAEVAGKTLTEVAGRLASVAIAYVYPAYRDVPLDVASVEAEITMPERVSPNARAVDVSVESITGIALGNSETVKPGFPGATLLATMQEFADQATSEKSPKEGEKPMDLKELKQAIRDGKLKPSDVFDVEEITEDSIVRGVLRERRRNEEGYEQRQLPKLEAEKARLEQDKKDLQDQLAKLSRGLLKTRVADLLKPVIEKRKLDDKQSAFITRNLAKFEPTTEEALPGELDRFVDAQLDVLKEAASVFGIKSGEAGGAGVTEGKSGEPDLDALLTPDALKDKTAK